MVLPPMDGEWGRVIGVWEKMRTESAEERET